MGALVYAPVVQWLTIPITSNKTADDLDTGVDLPLGATVVGAAWTVTVPDAGVSIGLGIQTDTGAWLYEASVDSAGVTVSDLSVASGNILYMGSKFFPAPVTADRRRVWVSSSAATRWRGNLHILYFNPPA